MHLNLYLKLCIYGNHAETTGTIDGGSLLEDAWVGERRGSEQGEEREKAREHSGGCAFRDAMLLEETGILFPNYEGESGFF